MGLLNKSFRDIKKDFSTGQGWSNSLFKTTITQNDFQNLQKFNSAINNTNDGLTKSQRITKAWNANMTGCSIAAKRMGNDLVTGKKTIKDISAAMNNASTSTKALGIAMNVLANVGLMLAITAVTKVISELSQAQEKAVQMAKEATESYKDEISSISDYKTRLSELHKELNSGNLSYEETKTKRSELMSIQDELIKKFGTEKTAIEAVTKAIDGQVNSLDTLNEKSYREWVAKADEQTFWNKLLPGGKSGLDQAVDYMESDQTISFFDMSNANSRVTGQYADLNATITDEVRAIQEEIDKTIQSKYNLEKEFATFKLTGTPDEIKAQLEAIRQDYIDLSKDAFLDNGISSEYWEAYRSEAIDSINEVINKLDDGLTKHQDTYKTYIEGMIKYDSEYSDEYATILQKRAELESAQNSGNKEEIQKARQSFMEAISKGIEASGTNENVKKYFETLYPELQSEFASWNFEFSLNANTDGIKDIAAQIGEKYTATNLLDMINTEGVQEGEDSFNKLIDKAIEYGICTDNSAEEVQKLIDLLVELGIVQGEIPSENANKMTVSLSELEGASDKIKTLSSAFKELSGDGYITTKTLGEIQTATDLSGDKWAEYESKLLTAKKGSAEFSQIMADLTYKMLDQTFANKDLNSLTEQQISAILRENGVVNADAVAHDWLTKAKETLRIKTALAKASTADAVVALATEASQAGITGNALNDLILDMGIFNNTSLDVSQKVAALQEMGYYAHWTAQGLANIDKVKKYTINGKDYIASYDGDKLVGIEQEKEIDIPKVEVPKITIPNYSGATSGGKSGSDNTPNYKDPTEAIINRINLRANESKQEEESIQDAIEIAKLENDDKKQISLLNDLIDNRKKRASILETANAGFDNEMQWLKNQYDWDEDSWFDSQGNATEAYYTLFNSSSKADQKIIEELFNKLSKYKKAYMDNAEEIKDINAEILRDEQQIADLKHEEYNEGISDRDFNRDKFDHENPDGDGSSFLLSNIDAAKEEIKRLEAEDPEGNKEIIQQLWRDIWGWEDEIDEYREKGVNDYLDTAEKLYDASGDEAKYINDLQWALNNLNLTEEERLKINQKIKDTVLDVGSEIERVVKRQTDALQDRADAYDIVINKNQALVDGESKFYETQKTIRKAQREINSELNASKKLSEWMDEHTRQFLFNEEDYDVLSSKLQGLQRDTQGIHTWYQNQINGLTEENWYLEESITKEYERRLAAKEREYEIARAELDLAKKQSELNNILAEKNVTMVIGGQLQQVADYQKVMEATEEMANLESDLAEIRLTNEQQNSLDMKNARNDGLRDEKAAIENHIKMINEKTGELKEAIENFVDTVGDLSKLFEALTGFNIPGLEDVSGGLKQKLKPKSSGYSFNVDSENKVVKVQSDGKAPAGLKEGDVVLTAGGAYRINMVNPDGSYVSGQMDNIDYSKKSGYASGTSNALKGIHQVNELGDETYIAKDGAFHNFAGGEIVFTKEESDRLMSMIKSNYQPIPFNLPKFTPYVDTRPMNSGTNNTFSGNIIVQSPRDYDDFLWQLNKHIGNKIK